MEITRTYSEKFAEHVLTLDGREVATAHKISPVMWSVKVDGKLLGLAPNETVALAHLDRFAATLRAQAA